MQAVTLPLSLPARARIISSFLPRQPVDYTHGGTAITLFNYPKDSGRIIVCNGEPSRLLPTQSPTLPAACSNLYAPQGTASARQSALISSQPSICSSVALAALCHGLWRVHFCSPPFPRITKREQGEKGAGKRLQKRPPPPRLGDAARAWK